MIAKPFKQRFFAAKAVKKKRPALSLRLLFLLARCAKALLLFMVFALRRYPLICLIFILSVVFFAFVTDNALWRQQQNFVFNNLALYAEQATRSSIIELAPEMAADRAAANAPLPAPEHGLEEERLAKAPLAPSFGQGSLKAPQKQNTAPSSEQGSTDVVGLFIDQNLSLTKDESAPNLSVIAAPAANDYQNYSAGYNKPLAYEFWQENIPLPQHNPHKQPVTSANQTIDQEEQQIFEAQQALRNFGYGDISLSKNYNEAFREALRDFQRLFALEITGKADAATLKKMRELGLITTSLASY